MIYVAFRDLIWRRRRYLISLIGCGLVFGLSLVQTGLSDSFPIELDHTIANLNARGFVVPQGTTGPFTGANPVAQNTLPTGVTPLAYLLESANPGHSTEVGMFGVPIGSRAEPQVTSGRQLRSADEALVDDASPFKTGGTVTIGKGAFTVVGRVKNFSINAGMPGVVVSLPSMQNAVFHGLTLITSGVVTGARPQLPSSWTFVTPAAARDDCLRILANALKSIDLIKVLLWIVAALIVGSVIFLSTVERTTDIAVFKAIGTSTGALAQGLAVQAIVLSILASIVGIGIAVLVAPVFPLKVDLSVKAAVILPAVAAAVGLVASIFGLRRAISIDPAKAFSSGA